MSLRQHLLKQRREAKRLGTSSDPLRGPPSPKGKAGYRVSPINQYLPYSFKLAPIQLRIEPVLLQQRRMVALLDDPAIAHDQYHIRLPYGG